MASRYVPPALRAQGRGGNGDKNPGYMSTPADHVSPGLRGGDASKRQQRRRSNVMPEEEVYFQKEIYQHFWPNGECEAMAVETSQTLHASAATPDNLAYVLLFRDANPRWEADGIIFTKSSLHLLPAEVAEPAQSVPDPSSFPDFEDATPGSTSVAKYDEPQEHQKHHGNATSAMAEAPTKVPRKERQPIAVFAQLGRRLTHRSFKFLGYYRITRLQFLEPRTPDLEKMLHQKWTITDPRTGKTRQRQREGKGWEKSFSFRWAVVKFEKDEQADKERGEPDIKRIEDEEDYGGGREKKSVNELMKELRVKDDNTTAAARKKSDEEQDKQADVDWWNYG